MPSGLSQLSEQALTTRSYDPTAGAGDVWRYHGLWLNEIAFFDRRSITTVGGEITFVDAETGESKPESLAYSLVVQADLALLPSRALLISGASRFETIRYRDGLGTEIFYRNANPRISIIGKIRDEHDIRVTAASAYRLPSAAEVTGGGSLVEQVPGEPLRYLLAPNDGLKPERTESIEVGYRGDILKRLRVELVTYMQRLRDVVVPEIDGNLPFVFVNGEDVDQLGLELGTQLVASERTLVYTNFTARRTRGEPAAARAWPDYIIGLGTDNTLGHGVRLHADASFVLGVDQLDVGTLPGTPLLVSAIHSVPNQFDLNLRLGKMLFDDRAEVYLSARNLLGFVRDREDLVQLTGGLQTIPVGALVLVGLNLYEG